MKDTETSKILSFFLLALVFFGASLIITSFPLITLPLERTLNISHSLAGLLYTILLSANALGKFVESFAADHYGRELFVLYPGFLMVLGMIGFALSPSYWSVSLFIFLAGLGQGLFIPAGFAAVSDLFPDQRGKYVGLYDAIFPLSALGAYGMVRISNLLGGWRYTVGMIGVFLFVSSTVFYFLYQSPDRRGEANTEETFSPSRKMARALREAKSCPVFLQMVTLIIPVSIFALGIQNFIPAYVVEGRGLTEGFGNIVYIVFMGLAVVGKTLSGRVVDRKGFRWTFVFLVGVVFLGLTIFSQVAGLWALALGVFLIGPPRGGLYTVMHANLLDSAPAESVDLLYGLFTVSLTVFGGIGPSLLGTLIDNIGFRLSFVVFLFVILTTIPVVFHVGSSNSPASE
ncbi:MFS transporter [Candidatus Bipolaricaulota bacterium]|nr:MFS transporter [Candidatus Bipolaricaulota bacterium]